MPLWKSLLLHLYYYGTLPLRARRNRAEATLGRAPIVVLFYHRIADDGAGEWTYPTGLFRRQMEWLAPRFDAISLEEAQRRIRSGDNRRPAVCITFDDGYAANCETALPLLIEAQIPCTYFVGVENVLEGKPFPHDVARRRPLAPNTVEQLRGLAACGVEIGCHTRTHADLGAIRDRNRLHDEIVAAGEELQSAIDHPVRYFAFPFGQYANLNAEAFHLAYEAGYDGVCSAYGGVNLPGDDAFHLQRVPGDPTMIRLKNWLTGDPRKRSIARFEYDRRVGSPGKEGAVQP